MKAAFSTWENRIAPVFDVARQLQMLEVDSGRILGETIETLESDVPMQKAHRLAELGTDELVCGAISRPLQAMVAAYGIRVIPFVAGELREVIEAWLGGRLEGEGFAMPGCCGRNSRRFQGAGVPLQEGASAMRGGNRRGQGTGRGMGRGVGVGAEAAVRVWIPGWFREDGPGPPKGRGTWAEPESTA